MAKDKNINAAEEILDAEILDTGEISETPTETEAAKGIDPDMELVEFYVPIDMANPKDSTLLIIINGHFYKMQRGETVNVPRCVKKCYEDQQKQLLSTFKLQDKYEKNVNLTDG